MFQVSTVPVMPRPPPVAHIDYHTQRALRADLNTAMRSLRGTVGSVQHKLHYRENAFDHSSPSSTRNKTRVAAMQLTSNEESLQEGQPAGFYYVTSPSPMAKGPVEAYAARHDPLRVPDREPEPVPVGIRGAAPVNRTVSTTLKAIPFGLQFNDENSPVGQKQSRQRPGWNSTKLAANPTSPLAVANLNSLISMSALQNSGKEASPAATVLRPMGPIPTPHYVTPPRFVADPRSVSIPESLRIVPVQRHVKAWVSEQHHEGEYISMRNEFDHSGATLPPQLPVTSPPSPMVVIPPRAAWHEATVEDGSRRAAPIVLQDRLEHPTATSSKAPSTEDAGASEQDAILQLTALINTLTAENESLATEAALFWEQTELIRSQSPGKGLDPLVAAIYDRHTLGHTEAALEVTMTEIGKIERLNSTLRAIAREAPLIAE